MKIYELPAEIQQHVLKLQVQAGNVPDLFRNLCDRADQGNFDWHKSGDSLMLWKLIDKGFYNKFYENYPNPLPSVCDTKKNSSFSEHLADTIMKEQPLTLSDNSFEELRETIVKVLSDYNIDLLDKFKDDQK